MQPEVNDTDSMLRVWAWFLDNQMKLASWAGTLVVIGLAFYAYLNFQDNKEIAAGQALSNIQTPRQKDAQKPGEMAASLLAVAKDHAGTKAAAQAVLRAGTALFNDGKFSEAQAQFERFLSLEPSSPFASQAAYGIAASLQAAGKLAEAQTKFDEVSKRYSTEGVAEDAKLALANLHILQNKPELAHKLLDEITQTSKGSPGSQEAFAKRMELEQKYPYLRTNIAIARPSNAGLMNSVTSALAQAIAKGVTNTGTALTNATAKPTP